MQPSCIYMLCWLNSPCRLCTFLVWRKIGKLAKCFTSRRMQRFGEEVEKNDSLFKLTKKMERKWSLIEVDEENGKKVKFNRLLYLGFINNDNHSPVALHATESLKIFYRGLLCLLATFLYLKETLWEIFKNWRHDMINLCNTLRFRECIHSNQSPSSKIFTFF